MKVTGTLKQYVDVEVEPVEMVKELLFHFFKTRNCDNLIEKENKLYIENEAFSIHGSSNYEYIELTNDPKMLEIYRALKTLLINIKYENIMR